MTQDATPDLQELPDETAAESIADVVGADLVPLSVGAIPVIRDGDDLFIAFRHAVQALGLDYASQWRRIRARQWASVVIRTTKLRDGRRMQMVTVDVRTFVMWLATLDESRVRDELRPAVIAYQREAADVLNAYWMRGIAVNHRRVSPTERALIEARHDVIGALNEGHYWWQVAQGKRPEEHAESRSVAMARACRAFERGYVRLVKVALPINRDERQRGEL